MTTTQHFFALIKKDRFQDVFLWQGNSSDLIELACTVQDAEYYVWTKDRFYDDIHEEDAPIFQAIELLECFGTAVEVNYGHGENAKWYSVEEAPPILEWAKEVFSDYQFCYFFEGTWLEAYEKAETFASEIGYGHLFLKEQK